MAPVGSGATHAVVPNNKNDSILVSSSLRSRQDTTDSSKIGMRDGVTGNFSLRSRNEATVSVFDSNFLVGDGIWVS